MRTMSWMHIALAAVLIAMASRGITDAEPLSEYVAPSLLDGETEPAAGIALHPSAMETAVYTTATSRRRVTSIERWERFEAEFGIKKREDSIMFGSLQEAKYQLDRATFTMQELILTVEEALRFDYGLSDLGLPVTPSKSPRSTSGDLWWDAVQNARFKSDVSLNVGRESFVGVKLVLPIGD